MPDALTHLFMCEDTLHKLPYSIKDKIDLPIFKLGSQGPDVFFYHHIFPWSKKTEVEAFGHYMHEHKTGQYFKSIISYIKENKLANNANLLGYLYGLICHYALDTTTHPYIFYFTGDYQKDDPDTYKYRGLHLRAERWIDAYLIFERTNDDPNRFKHYKYFLECDVPKDLENMIDYTVNEVYDKQNYGQRYVESRRDMYHAFRYLFMDRHGIKKYLYKLYDKYINKSGSIVYETISYYINLNSHQDYLNEERQEYCHPANNEVVANYSFMELYYQAIEIANEMIVRVNDYLEGKDTNLNNVFKNLSYSTGLNCDEKALLQYFKI